ncbi:MAG: hypothetical protein HC769_23765 [Cyanobacteria bacterium CRU_2_1]|nr:hypothetical protein [Cyanobacteria bacterium RU_5_0]NJR61586.1 hypothetical protein [Cyanobacteria bacterium CRU_2_1]
MTQEPISKPVKPIGRGPGSLIAGATYPLRALWLFLKMPQLRQFILVPILLNLVLGMTIYAGSLFLGLRALDSLFADLPQWIANAPDLTTNFPAVHFPAIHFPAVHLPDWHLNLPNWTFPSFNWNLYLPNWHINLPDWHLNLPNVQITLPDWVNHLPNWGLAIVIWLVRVLLTIALFIVTGFVFLQFGVLLGAPWYGKLSEEIEKAKTGQLFRIEVHPVVDIWRAIQYELKKLVLTIPLGILLLLLNFFPGIGTAIATIAGIALGSTIVCMDFFDAAVERRRPRFRQKLGIVFRSLPASAAFGFVCLGLVSIPLVNLIAIPVCVAAGTLFFCDRILPWFQPSNE